MKEKYNSETGRYDIIFRGDNDCDEGIQNQDRSLCLNDIQDVQEIILLAIHFASWAAGHVLLFPSRHFPPLRITT